MKSLIVLQVCLIGSIFGQQFPRMPSLNAELTTRSGGEEGREIFNLWSHSLEQYKSPKTIVVPVNSAFTLSLRTDIGNPLFDTTPFASMLRELFLKDLMIEESIAPNDERIASKNGLRVQNFLGKDVVFKQLPTRIGSFQTTINDIPVETTETLKDGTNLYFVEDLTPEQRKRVRQAYDDDSA